MSLLGSPRPTANFQQFIQERIDSSAHTIFLVRIFYLCNNPQSQCFTYNKLLFTFYAQQPSRIKFANFLMLAHVVAWCNKTTNKYGGTFEFVFLSSHAFVLILYNPLGASNFIQVVQILQSFLGFFHKIISQLCCSR